MDTITTPMVPSIKFTFHYVPHVYTLQESPYISENNAMIHQLIFIR